MSKETRLQEIKRCLDRAEELGGSELEGYHLDVSDMRYLYDKLVRVKEYAQAPTDAYGQDLDHILRILNND